MALKQILVSDISQKDIPEGQEAKVTVRDHPANGGAAVELDLSSDEAGKLQAKQLDLVTVTIQEGGRSREVVMDAASFDAAFKGVDIKSVLKNARRASTGTRRRSSGGAKAPKVDYTSPEHAGQLHRGRTTDAEVEFVKANPDIASKNRERQTGKPIDWDDPKERKRYRLDD